MASAAEATEPVITAAKHVGSFLLGKLGGRVGAGGLEAGKAWVEALEGLAKGEAFLARPAVLTLAAELKSSALPVHVRASRGLVDPQVEEPPPAPADDKPDAWIRPLLAALHRPPTAQPTSSKVRTLSPQLIQEGSRLRRSWLPS